MGFRAGTEAAGRRVGLAQGQNRCRATRSPRSRRTRGSPRPDTGGGAGAKPVACRQATEREGRTEGKALYSREADQNRSSLCIISLQRASSSLLKPAVSRAVI